MGGLLYERQQRVLLLYASEIWETNAPFCPQ